MRWTRRGRSPNLVDRRGRRVGRGTIGCGTLLVLVVLSVVFQQDFLSLLGPTLVTEDSATPAEGFRTDDEEEMLVDFVSFVLDDVQATWDGVFDSYRDATLVLFRDAVQSACGYAGAASGPFYCPGDETIYLDLSFFDELDRRFGAPGDFAQAYVIAHEVGHHVQSILGIEREVRGLQARRPGEANELSVLMELQADCLAGVWGGSTQQRGLLEPGDVEEGMRAAAAIGDDRIQRMSQGHVVPESFTHGSSGQRIEWLRRGFDARTLDACDTFAAGAAR